MTTTELTVTRRTDQPTDQSTDGTELAMTLSLGLERRRVDASLHQRVIGDADLVRIGRFRVIHRIGAGGMGEVYLCEDDALEREIAVKRVLGQSSEGAEERLRHEARALARFSHDNIVQLHEIGDHEGSTFIAMEFVEGHSLGEWLREGERPWTEVCDHFLAAGRGLAAAHEQGIVHRDFKPDNVLVRARDGRVKVADFGLVLDERADTRETPGLVVGTPRYMAPEQMRGEHADARSDQFSFCLALYEGVWGGLPFSAQKFHDRLRQLEDGDIIVPDSHRALFRVIRRGLEGDPSRRWPSMDALLSALHHVRHAARRRRRWAGLVAGIAATMGLSLLVFGSAAGPTLNCEAGLDGVWDASARAGVERHLGTLEARHAGASGERLLASLDRWASAWSFEHAQLCEQFSRTRDFALAQQGSVRAACLSRQRGHVAELVGAVEQGDGDMLAQALVAAAQLPQPEDCATARAGLGVEPPPPSLTSTIEGLRGDIEATRLQRVLGRFDEALAGAERIIEAAVELDYAPLEAEARAELAKIEAESGDPTRAATIYDEAIHLAQSSHHDQLAAELLLERVELSLHRLPGDHSVALRLEQAETALDRVDAGDSLRARSSFAAGRLAEHGGDHALARQRYSEALVGAEAVEAVEQPYYLTALATVTSSQGSRLQLRLRALELARERFGPDHPRTALLLYNHGLELQAAGHEAEAAAELRLAAEIWSESLTPSHKLRAKTEQRFAMAALARRELDAAERHALEAARILDERLPATDPERGEPAFILAQIAAMRADVDGGAREVLRTQAIFHAQRAIRLFESQPRDVGPDSRLASVHQLLGNQLMSLDRLAEAELAFERASALGGDESAAAITSLRLAELALRRGELADAALHLDAVEPSVDGLGAELPCYALLWALVDLRLGRLGDARLAELRAARSEYPEMDPALRVWLEQLGVDPTQRAQLEL